MSSLILSDVPQDARIKCESGPATFSFTLAELSDGPLTVDAGGLGQRVTAAQVPRGPRPVATHFAFRDADAAEGTNAYWLRVIQRDGAMAWSSPIYVEIGQ